MKNIAASVSRGGSLSSQVRVSRVILRYIPSASVSTTEDPHPLTPQLRRIDDLLRAGHTPHEVAEDLGLQVRTITGHVSRLRQRSRDLFRRERAAERAPAYQDCHRLQETLWKVIEHLMPPDATPGTADESAPKPDPKAVPPVARAYLDTIKIRESLRDADDKHIQNGQLSVRDIYAALDPAEFDDTTAADGGAHTTAADGGGKTTAADRA